MPATGRQETANVAINAYDPAQLAADIATMRALGLTAYRFSVSWPRVMPEGTGAVNAAGLAYYDRLVDDLLAAGIAPLVTLYHWDFPWALHEKGGFHNRAVIDWFRDYAEVMFDKLGDRVPAFITMNEPFIDLFLMDLVDENVRSGRRPMAFTAAQYARQLPALHNLYVASAATVAAYRASKRAGEIGIALPLYPTEAADPARAEDVAAAATWDLLVNRWPLDAAVKGEVRDDVLDMLRRLDPKFGVSDEDRAMLKNGRVDFVGVNFYSPASAAPTGAARLASIRASIPIRFPPSTAPSVPTRSTRLLMRLKNEYGEASIVITENGAGFGPRDEVMEDGVVEDPLRADYVVRHIEATLRARADGADVRGYMEWCLFDNFEWFRGYDTRFGMVHVDFATQKRTPKRSYFAYRDLIARHKAGAPAAKKP